MRSTLSGTGRRARLLVAALAGLTALTALPAVADSTGTSTLYLVSAPAGGSPDGAVLAAGGTVRADLAGLSTSVASLTGTAAQQVAQQTGLVVAPDIPMVADMSSTSTTSRPPAAVFPESTGASTLVADGVTGAGTTVAVLDTGIDALPDFAGRLIGGVDLTGENNPYQDDFGHGTFVAGLIAGDGASSNGQYMGEAPGADLVSIKVAGASGQTDSATVIEGILWAIAHRVDYHIGVLNLSLGGPVVMPSAVDPLDRAVEAAWRAGIVVVTSAGNDGPAAGSITSPGNDPLAITAGAVDDNGTVTQSDDTVPSFSAEGPTAYDGWFKPDLLAAGRSVVSLAAPGSTIYQDYPSARIGAANFVGSGTSFSAAVTSGAAALVLAAHPQLAPDEVKAALLASTTPGPTGNVFSDGHGQLNALNAVNAPAVSLTQTPGADVAMGSGSVGLGDTWAQSSWNAANWNTTSWNTTSWNSTSWNSTSWNTTSWNSTSWNAAAWD